MQNVTLDFGNGVKITAERMDSSEILALTQPPTTARRALPLDDYTTGRIAGMIVATGERILAIKFVRATLDIGLKEAKQWVDDRFPHPSPSASAILNASRAPNL
jgi:hypothetical protein